MTTLPDVATVPRDELPELLGQLTTLEARVRLRLAEPVAAQAAPSQLIDADKAALIADTTRRTILAKTRGHRCRRDLSRKLPRFDEAELRAWLASRRAR